MAIVATRVTVDNTEDTLLVATAGQMAGTRIPISVQNIGAVEAFLGGAGVTAATGHPLAAGASVGWAINATSVLHAITAAGSTVLSVMVD